MALIKEIAPLVTELVTVLIGLPCSGKSTYLKTIDYDFVISSDNIVDILCRQNNLAYNDYFKLAPKSSLKHFHNMIFDKMIDKSKAFNHVVWDLTNLTKKSRSTIFKYYPDAKFCAVFFDYGEKDELLLERNRRRFDESGKYIDEKVLKAMCMQLEPVSEEEPFDDAVIFSFL